MKILAIDTSSNICSVAILEDSNPIMKKDINDELTHSQKLMPLIDEILKSCNLSLNDIDLLACSIGPGSFTGIRIGVATVKAFVDVKNIPVVGVTSLESLAYNIQDEGLICSMIDARNDNIYSGLFKHKENTYTLIGNLLAEHIDNILPVLKGYDQKIIFVGNGSTVQKDKLLELPNANFANSENNLANAISIGKCAYNKFLNGEHGTSNTLLPLYLRKSQAERALEEKEKND
ncbi:MAG: tRNA (adenosine(37)-N6)-threonylcarbamoyltransferase complex dimerization subunit type 1 TsaB [Clostridia bacterium]|nr:tRNA (adenosine(37)-N6)-threonylcarbamoyltransferase complex dimerization subunit type 1 TsaB [Clostridia bacterium]